MGYFYVIEHIRTGKRYAGSRYAKSADVSEFFNEAHHKPYYTSSKIIKSILIEEGIAAFSILRIKEVDDARAYEAKFLNKINAKNNPAWLNQSNGHKDFRYKGGKKLSEQHRKNISKGNIGRVHSPETRLKISKSNTGKKMSDAAKQKMSRAWESRVVSEETKLKMSESRKGVGNSRYGAIVSEETRQKIRATQLGKVITPECREKQSIANKGRAKPKRLCSHCNKLIAVNVFKRFHGDNCKPRPRSRIQISL